MSKKNVEKGFIITPRSAFENSLWTEPREFSKWEAWQDLIRSAEVEATRRIVRNKYLSLERGEIVGSLRYLSERWNWGKTKTSNFIKMLVKLEQLDSKQDSGETVLVVVNYDKYQSLDTYLKQKTRQQTRQRRDSDETVTRQSKGTKRTKGTKEEEKDKKEFLKVFDSSFVENWDEFLDYRKEINKAIKSEISEKRLFDKLLKLSKEEQKTAELILLQSMENGWTGIFTIKNNQASNGKNNRTEFDPNQNISTEGFYDIEV